MPQGRCFKFLTLQIVRKVRSEEHTSELQSRLHLVCRLLLEKKKKKTKNIQKHVMNRIIRYDGVQFAGRIMSQHKFTLSQLLEMSRNSGTILLRSAVSGLCYV